MDKRLYPLTQELFKELIEPIIEKIISGKVGHQK